MRDELTPGHERQGEIGVVRRGRFDERRADDAGTFQFVAVGRLPGMKNTYTYKKKQRAVVV